MYSDYFSDNMLTNIKTSNETKLNDINTQIQQLKDSINNAKAQIKQLERQQDSVKIDIRNTKLIEFEKFVSEKVVVFDCPKKYYSDDLVGMNVHYFEYPLVITGINKSIKNYGVEYGRLKEPINCSNMYISEILPPNNNPLQKMVYPYVKELIEPHLPIKIELKQYSDDNSNVDLWGLKLANDNLNVEINATYDGFVAKVWGYCYGRFY